MSLSRWFRLFMMMLLYALKHVVVVVVVAPDIRRDVWRACSTLNVAVREGAGEEEDRVEPERRTRRGAYRRGNWRSGAEDRIRIKRGDSVCY